MVASAGVAAQATNSRRPKKLRPRTGSQTSQSDFVALERFLSNHRIEIIRVFPYRHVLCFFYLAGITFREVFDQHWNVFLTLAQRRHF